MASRLEIASLCPSKVLPWACFDGGKVRFDCDPVGIEKDRGWLKGGPPIPPGPAVVARWSWSSGYGDSGSPGAASDRREKLGMPSPMGRYQPPGWHDIADRWPPRPWRAG